MGDESIKPVIIIYGRNIYGLSFRKLPLKITARYTTALVRAISPVKEKREREREERARPYNGHTLTFNDVAHYSMCEKNDDAKFHDPSRIRQNCTNDISRYLTLRPKWALRHLMSVSFGHLLCKNLNIF